MSNANPIHQLMQHNLARFEPRNQSPDDLKHAAVAIVVSGTEIADGSITLTRRSIKLKTHRGQWALPGGRVDAGETIRQAALRELHEEVGLELNDDAILGLLDDYPTRAGFLITPVVVWGGEKPEFAANPAEVSSIHQISFAELNREDSPEFHIIEESPRPVVRMLVGDSYIHAPTAAVMYQFREVCLQGRSTRVDELEQPVFTWKK